MKKLLTVAITLLAMAGCHREQKAFMPYKIIDYKSYIKAGFFSDTRLPDGICVYGSDNLLYTFQDSCNKYQIGDTLK